MPKLILAAKKRQNNNRNAVTRNGICSNLTITRLVRERDRETERDRERRRETERDRETERQRESKEFEAKKFYLVEAIIYQPGFMFFI